MTTQDAANGAAAELRRAQLLHHLGQRHAADLADDDPMTLDDIERDHRADHRNGTDDHPVDAIVEVSDTQLREQEAELVEDTEAGRPVAYTGYAGLRSPSREHLIHAHGFTPEQADNLTPRPAMTTHQQDHERGAHLSFPHSVEELDITAPLPASKGRKFFDLETQTMGGLVLDEDNLPTAEQAWSAVEAAQTQMEHAHELMAAASEAFLNATEALSMAKYDYVAAVDREKRRS